MRKCSKCETSNKDEIEECIVCSEQRVIYSEPLEKHIEENKHFDEKHEASKPKSTNKKILIACAACIAVIFAIVFITNRASLSSKYEQAIECFHNGDYEQAVILFDELRDYNDSYDKRMKAKYEQANYYLENSDFEQAVNLFDEILFYKDSEEKCNRAKYKQAKQFMKEKEYDEAINLFTEMEDSLDVEDEIAKVKFFKCNDEFKELRDEEKIKKYQKLLERYYYVSYDKSVEKMLKSAKKKLYQLGIREYKYGDKEEKRKANCFKFYINSVNKIRIYSYKNGRTYTLYRQ